jgi:hypothetical protein
MVLAYTTWQRDPTVKPKAGTVELWPGSPGDVKAIQYEAQNKSVTLEKRGSGDESYFWGKVVRTSSPPPKKQKPDAGPEEALMSPADEETEVKPTVTTREFPVGEGGTRLMEKLAPLRVLRDLGPLDDAKKADFGLVDSKGKLAVTYASGPRELVIGGTVYGGSDRYAMDPKSSKGYVLPGEVVSPLEAAESSLRENKLHAFPNEEVTKVQVKAADKARTIVRRAGAAPPPPMDPQAPKPPSPALWADAASPDKPDQTLANFMDRVEKLSVIEFVPDQTTEGMTPITHLEYEGSGGKKLGHLELYRRPSKTNPSELEYFLKSERTRVLAKIHKLTAERVDQDLAQLLGLPPPPVSAPPPSPKTPPTPTGPPGAAPVPGRPPGAMPSRPGAPMPPGPRPPGTPPGAPGSQPPGPGVKPAPGAPTPRPTTPPVAPKPPAPAPKQP